MLITSAVALLPAASPVLPAPSTGTATSTLPGNHHDGALKPRQTDFLPAEYWPEAFSPAGWQGVQPGWGAVSRPCHVCGCLFLYSENSLTFSRPASSTPAPAPICMGTAVVRMLILTMAGDLETGVASATMHRSSSSACLKPKMTTPIVGRMDILGTVSSCQTGQS